MTVKTRDIGLSITKDIILLSEVLNSKITMQLKDLKKKRHLNAY